jgi:hypothetical protein
MAAGLRATAKAVEHPPEPKVGAPVLDPALNDTGRESATTTAALAKSADAITGQGPRSMQRGQFP